MEIAQPRSIMLFERLYLLAIAIELVRIAQQWPLLVQSSGSDFWGRIVAVALSLLLLLFASRRRKRGAGLMLAALFVIGLPMISYVLDPGMDPLNVGITVVQLALQGVALGLMFTPSSRSWFAATVA